MNSCSLPTESTSKTANTQSPSVGRNVVKQAVPQSTTTTTSQSNSTKDNAPPVVGKVSEDKSKEKGAPMKNGPLSGPPPPLVPIPPSSALLNGRSCAEPVGLLVIKHIAPDETRTGAAAMGSQVLNHVGAAVIANVNLDNATQTLVTGGASLEPDSSVNRNRKKSSFQITKVGN